MQTIELFPLLNRWIHILAVVIAVGGGFFMRFVLLPSLRTVLDDAKARELRGAIMKRWRIAVHSSVGLLLLTGTVNLLTVFKQPTPPPRLYHSLFGIKFLLALAIFYLVIMLTSSRDIAWIEKRRSSLMLLVVLMGIGVVFVSGMLRQLHI